MMVRIFFIGSLGLLLLVGASAMIKKFLIAPKKTQSNVIVKTTKAPIEHLFTVGEERLPIVETVTYESSVPWLKGRPAWIGDYATHYGTSRHFIARSLNGRPDYFTQTIAPGRKFNVFKKDRNFQFYLLVDVTSHQMDFYYLDLDTQEKVLLKTYAVGLGKKGEGSSGCLTPLGKFLAGDKIAVYKPGIMGPFQDRQVEMITVLGTRWIPFGNGLGIHGAPWVQDTTTGNWKEMRQMVGGNESGGSIYLMHEDMEEIFSIVITRPTTVEIRRAS
jgi:hypothetical protein